MFKQLLLPLAGVALFIVAVGIFTQKSSSLDLSKYIAGTNSPQGKTMTVGGKTINVEVVDTEPARENGLSGRPSLDQNSGMLFVFDSKNVNPVFWMKDMMIPLDIIWIHSSSGNVNDEKVVKITKKVPIPVQGIVENKLPTYSAGQPVDYVLEVNSGFSDSNNIKVGDLVKLP